MSNSYYEKAKRFIDKLPYKDKPYSSRNWGHPWHSLCSYHGKLKPSIAYFLVNIFTEKGQKVLDPLCGVGTIPFEACLQGRIGIGNDLSIMAYVITNAKLNKPFKNEVYGALDKLNSYIEQKKDSLLNAEGIPYLNFGFNGSLGDYFHKDTFIEILCAREYFVEIKNNISPADAVVWSCLLHVLHGNRPYALSRNSHSLTPYAPKGDFIYKNLIKHVKDKIDLSYSKGNWECYNSGNAFWGDYKELADKISDVDVIICSPPFYNSLKFYINNWMRLWFSGWDKNSFDDAEAIYLESKQYKDLDVYYSFFEICKKVLKSKGKMILHLGKSEKCDMAEELSKRARLYFDEVYRGSENVKDLEKHGIKDKGSTIEHQYLFLQKIE